MEDQPTLRDWLAMNASVEDVCREANDVPDVQKIIVGSMGSKSIVYQLDPDRYLKARYMIADKMLKIREMCLTQPPNL